MGLLLLDHGDFNDFQRRIGHANLSRRVMVMRALVSCRIKINVGAIHFHMRHDHCVAILNPLW